jgi:uncharacterized tellurite resistance protein B-like protein
MLSILRGLSPAFASAPQQTRERDLQLAAAVLLLEVSYADFEKQPEEKAAIFHALSRVFNLSDDEVAGLYKDAVGSADRAVSLYEFTALINQECSREEKRNLLEQLWRVAFADGRLDKYEDHRIRRIADLLHMPHREFIRSKHAAEGKGG